MSSFLIPRGIISLRMIILIFRVDAKFEFVQRLDKLGYIIVYNLKNRRFLHIRECCLDFCWPFGSAEPNGLFYGIENWFFVYCRATVALRFLNTLLNFKFFQVLKYWYVNARLHLKFFNVVSLVLNGSLVNHKKRVRPRICFVSKTFIYD